MREGERNKILYSYVGESSFPEILPSTKLTAHPPVKTATFDLQLLLAEVEQLGRKLPAIHFPCEPFPGLEAERTTAAGLQG